MDLEAKERGWWVKFSVQVLPEKGIPTFAQAIASEGIDTLDKLQLRRFNAEPPSLGISNNGPGEAVAWNKPPRGHSMIQGPKSCSRWLRITDEAEISESEEGSGLLEIYSNKRQSDMPCRRWSHHEVCNRDIFRRQPGSTKSPSLKRLLSYLGHKDLPVSHALGKSVI